MIDTIAKELIRNGAPARILVVEDESIVAIDLESQLREMGYDVCGCVDNGPDAIANACDQQPDLVLMDIVIKGPMDGVETADHIGRTWNIPVVFLTAYNDENTVRRAARTAAYGYLTKPFQTRELHAGIEVALYKARLERRLRNSEQWFSSTLRCLADGVVATDECGQICFMNPAAERMLGWSFDEAKGQDASEVIRVEECHSHASLASPVWRALGGSKARGMDFGKLLITRSGKRLPIDDSVAPIRDEMGNMLGGVVVMRDVQERLEAENRLRQSEERFRNVFDFAPVGMALVSIDNHFLKVNGAICRLLECDEAHLVGLNQAEVTHAAEMERERQCLVDLLSGALASVQFEKRYRTLSGKDVWTLVSMSLLRQNNEPFCFLLQIYDLTERKEAEYRLARLAHFDMLTGLANRAWLSEEIEREITSAKRRQRRLAVVFIDLDHFKQINDSLGHETGDELLRIVAAKLRASVRETDTVGRLGGDEFVILLPEIRTAKDILVVTDKVQTECAKPVRMGGHEISIGLSLGVSMFPDDAHDSRTLLRYADSALYHAKAEGRNNLQFYRTELTAQLEQRMRLSAGLRHALEHKEFELYYQPIVALSDRRPLAAEALIRWNHPELGLLTPDSFISLADEAGLSSVIGEWVIGEACRQAALWNSAGRPKLTVGVNVCPSQFRTGDLAQIVEDALDATRLEPNCLCIEITEQVMLNSNEKNCATIARLKALGVRIAIDDFGTGYSSLSYISQFGPTELKIDRSLISPPGINTERAAIVTAAIAMARSLKLEVVTEGVETEEQQAFLLGQGCDKAQGYLYGHPSTAKEFGAWLTHAGAREAAVRVA